MIKVEYNMKLKKLTFTYKKDCPSASRTVKAANKTAK